MQNDVVLTCAVTGAGDTTGKSAHVPVTPKDIATAAIDAAKAGASIAHIHARDPETGLGSRDPKLFKEAWQLNERHYGALTGLNKDEMKIKLGEEKVHQFRRSWDLRPDPLDKNNPYHPINIDTYKNIPINKIPDTESLKDTYERVLEFYKKDIENKISENNILISAHGNSIRALCKYLFKLDENQISKLEIPTGNPLLISLDGNKKITDCKYLDNERAKDLVVF